MNCADVFHHLRHSSKHEPIEFLPFCDVFIAKDHFLVIYPYIVRQKIIVVFSFNSCRKFQDKFLRRRNAIGCSAPMHLAANSCHPKNFDTSIIWSMWNRKIRLRSPLALEYPMTRIIYLPWCSVYPLRITSVRHFPSCIVFQLSIRTMKVSWTIFTSTDRSMSRCS